MINWRFILTATLTYIPFTVFWFFWHNNLLPGVYYYSESMSSLYSMESQNIWAMNFANALLVYGFVYFYFRSVKPGIKIINSTVQGIYYGISVIGFYSFLNFGMLQQWSLNVLIHELIFAVIGGVFCGLLVYYLYKRFYPFDLSKRSDG